MVTFGKAFGVSVAALLCSDRVARYFEQCCRHLIYSTAMPSAHAVAIQAALGLVGESELVRARLRGHIARFRDGVKTLPHIYTPIASDTAIQPLIMGDDKTTLAPDAAPARRGIWCDASTNGFPRNGSVARDAECRSHG